MREEFLRLERLLGEECMARLEGAHVLIAGVGAVGGWALEALVRSGLGHVRIVDFDVVMPSNINRQVVAVHSSIGMRKVEAASRRALDINPMLDIEAVECYIDDDNVDELVCGMDLVLDCIDSVKSKVALVRSCQKSGTTLMSSMGAALRRDLGAVRVAPLSKTSGCPLARSVRRLVRKEGLRDDYLTVYSPEPVVFDYSRENEEREDERVKPTLGSMMTVTALFGLSLAHEAIRHIVGSEDFLALH